MTTQNLLNTALKASEPTIQEYVKQLKTTISKLNKQIAKLEIEKDKFKDQNKTYKKRISVLQKDLDKARASEVPHFEYVCPSSPTYDNEIEK